MESMKTYLVTLTGLVQGVGLRPFIFRLAHEFKFKGWVNNTNENVQVALNADPGILEDFLSKLQLQAPPAASIESIDVRETEPGSFEDFRILESENLSDAVTRVSPDIAVCDACLADMKQQPNRIDYPFLNCTNCGPRFTIVSDLPYDRALTTMQEFTMCSACRTEYENVLDRRFHAQPTACRDCGPQYSLVLTRHGPLDGPENGRMPRHEEVIARTAELIDREGIAAVKGLGGFFLACDALNEAAVKRLRASKHREGKPFAVMFRNLDCVREYCQVTGKEEDLLTSWQRPIVVLKNREVALGHHHQPGQSTSTGYASRLANSVSNGFPTTGAMLPYMPFHYLLFEYLKTPVIVMTSGNLSEEPIIIDNRQAESVLGPVSGAVVHFNRDIHNRCDDSVMLAVGEKPRFLRRSRGYVPTPVTLNLEVEGIFAAGAELVNCFALGKGKECILSQHIGDLKNYETYEFYRETFGRFKRLFRLEPRLVAHDMHPDYLSTRFATELGLPSVRVQHHHAHIAAVLAEHQLNEKVVGVSFDGTGFGDDGNIWGSEFLVCDLEKYQRITHFTYMSMPGGDKATQEPWRMAVSYLYSLFGRDLAGLGLPFLQEIEPGSLELVIQSIEKNVNCPFSSGAGRLFDAVSAMLGLCTVSQFHAEAPMRLESAILEDRKAYPFTSGKVINLDPTIEGIVEDIKSGLEPGHISARFHNTIAKIILETVAGISRDHGIKKVALSGGTFQNRYLSEMIEDQLAGYGFEVIVPLRLPPNDGGIALGQLAVAARHRSMGLV
jgi:hydrogenase maturation protein HypF